MNSREIVKKYLLNRKIQEYVIRKPNSKEFIVKGSFGGQNTVWKVKKEGKSFNIVEVNTNRSEFVMKEAPVGGQSPAPISPGGSMPLGGTQSARQFNVGQLANVSTQDKIGMIRDGIMPLTGDTIAATFSDMLKPGAGRDVVALRDVIQQNHTKAPPEAKAAVGSALGFLTNLSNQKRLMGASKSPNGISEADEKEEEPMSDVPPPGRLESEPTKSDKEDPASERMKTGEELHLQQLVDSKPIQDINVNATQAGGTVIMKLAGLENPVKIKLEKGKASYSLGDLSRVLSTVPTG